MIDTLARWTKSAAQMGFIVLLVLAAKAALAEPFYVPSGSMEPTLMIGDALVATKFPYGYSMASLPLPVSVRATPRIFGALPERGDVVVFRWPGDPSQTWVKRVIGLPGDRIALDNGRVFINGVAAAVRPDGVGDAEDDSGNYIKAARYIETLPGGRAHEIFKMRTDGMLDNMPEMVVPPGHLFVMGDNRDNSADSRYWGFVPRSYVVGKPLFVYWSYDAPTADLTGWTLDHVLDVAQHFFTRTRWERAFSVPRSQAAQEAGGAR
jgi:signal peptidase I